MSARTVPLKVGPAGRLSLAHPLARCGRVSDAVYIVHVEDVPADVPSGRAMLAARDSMAAAMAARTGYRVRWADLPPPVSAMDHPDRDAAFVAAMADGDIDRAEVLARAPVPETWPAAVLETWGARRRIVRNVRGVPS